MFRGKKYKESAKKIDRSVLYDTADAMKLVVDTASAKFDETVELHVKLGVDSRPPCWSRPWSVRRQHRPVHQGFQ